MRTTDEQSHHEQGHVDRPAVCIVHHSYYPQHGHMRRDAETLTRHGYDVTVIALHRDGQPRQERLNGVHVYRLPLTHERGSLWRYALEYARLMGLTFVTLTRLHWRKRFRVIEIDNMPDALVFSALVPKLMGAKVILYIFDNMPELMMVARGKSARHPLVRLLALQERVSAAFADRVIVTQETARQLASERGIPGKKVTVVLNGPDESIFTPPRLQEHPGTRTGASDTFEIVTHGTILERFGIQILIQALPRIIEQVPNVRVTVFGEGEYRPALEDLARTTGVADRVCFGGWVPLEQLPSVLSRFDLGYVGMLCNNMLSNKLMEYVAVGLPIVAARWPTYQHYFDDDSVAYFEAGSSDSLAAAIIGVYRDRPSALRRAARAAHRFVRYSWSAQRHIYCALYETLTGSARLHPETASAVRPHVRRTESTPAPALPAAQPV
ncbi:MAG: glycosyltransferase family 4 protein [Chloroflexota bacterium]